MNINEEGERRRRRFLLGMLDAQVGNINRTCPIISPTLGDELLTNGNMETWETSTNLGTWAESIAGTSTINQEGTIKHGGDYSCRMDVDASNSLAQIAHTVSALAGDWLQAMFWLYASAGSKSAVIDFGTNIGVGGGKAPGAVQTQYTITGRVYEDNPSIKLRRSSAASASLYFDDVSIKKISNTTVKVGTTSIQAGTYICHPTMADDSQCGFDILRKDASNFVRVMIERAISTDQAKILTCTAGVYAVLAQPIGNIVYGAAKELNAIVQSNGTISLYYDGTQVGTDGSVTLANFQRGVYGFSSLSGNTVGAVTTNP